MENFFEKWFEGKFQKSFSYEVVSLEGYTQFLIRTPKEFRDLIESSVYSQYPLFFISTYRILTMLLNILSHPNSSHEKHGYADHRAK